MAFIVFEGVDASGKSLLLNLFTKELQNFGIQFIQTKEPGGTKIGQQIRKILLEKKNKKLDSLAETLLYYADRQQHIQEVIAPQLKNKLWVISDRYWASSSAYQSGARAVSKKLVNTLKEEVCKNYQPDLWVLLDICVEMSLKRLSRKEAKDRLESEHAGFHQVVRDSYLKLAKSQPEKWLILDASQDPKKLLKDLMSHLKSKALLN
ncbi:MAG: dTMP kinase [Bdellovibrionales bacterium]|nr:dTMP kinase [Bdellovibrionales bacterium]